MLSIDRIVSDTQSLVRIDSQNPGPLEHECADWVRERLGEAGVQTRSLPVTAGRDNIVATVAGDPTGPRLVLLAHMDTVPFGEGWDVAPLSAEISDGRIYGRGTCDMKAGLAASINLVTTLSESGLRPAGDVVLVATVDEEAPGMLGAHSLVESGFLRPTDQVLAPEPTGMRLRIAQMGLRWLTLRVHGRMAHAGRAHLGIDANHAMAEVVSRLKVAIAELPHDDPLLGRPRFTCGTVLGGVATNVVPPSCEAGLDVRIVPPMSIDDAEAIVREVAERVMEEFPGARYELEALGAARPPVRASEDSKIVQTLRAAYADEFGADAPVGGADGHEAYTDASMVAALTGSTSCTVFGPGATDHAHTANEFVPIDDLVSMSRILWSLVDRW